MQEEWKSIKGFENSYEVSNLGNVRSIDRYCIQKKTIEYIENAQERDENEEACSLYVPDLLNILKGEDNK